MLTMQDPNDGGVYHKCTNASFDAMIMPDKAVKPRYVVQKSTAAALDFTAVMAQSARVFKHFSKQLPGFSDSCLKAAEYAWQWALKYPEKEYDQEAMNKLYAPPVTTGAYGDRHFNDEWFWAAAELYTSTKNKTYMSAVMERMSERVGVPSWNFVTMLGYYTLIRLEKQLPADAKPLIQQMKDTVIRMADQFISSVSRNAFHTVMGQTVRDFSWGGNAIAANQGILLFYAYRIKADRKYLSGALDNLDYILGRNATGYCFITGIGSKPPMHPHHRPSVADGIEEPVPGLMVGGPNPGRQDKCTYTFFEPETSYVDSDCAYAANEIAINWNAPIAYLANAVEAMQSVWKK
jgi:endoglucanase